MNNNVSSDFDEIADEVEAEEGVVFAYTMHCRNGFPVIRAEVESIRPDLLELSTFGTIELDKESAEGLIAQLKRFVDGDLTLEKAHEFTRVIGGTNK